MTHLSTTSISSGKFNSQDTDVLGFAVEPTQRERLAAWSQAYMETVAQQRVRWSAFLGANQNKKTLQDSTRHRLKLLMRLGVPPELRHRVWRLTTGSFAKQRRAAVRRCDTSVTDA